MTERLHFHFSLSQDNLKEKWETTEQAIRKSKTTDKEGYSAKLFGLPDSSVGKEFACNMDDLGWEDSLEKEKATHSSILA